jgi:RNA polymerase sigma-70 factor, ECF subfamily
MWMSEAAALTACPDAPDALARARAGDEAGFTELVREHQSMVFGLAFHFLRHRAEAEELAQAVFVALYQNLARMESAAHVTFWLRKVTSRRCIDRVRRLSWRLERATDRLPEQTILPSGNDPLLSGVLRELVAQLAPQARMVVTLRFQEELQISEIAQTLDMPVNTVKSHLRRALDTLRSKLAVRGISDEA